MSHVDNVMVSHGITEPETIKDALQQPAGETQRGQRLTIQTGDDTTWGGHKVPECEVYAAAFNYLAWDEFAEWVTGLPWHEPGLVQVFVQWQEADAWSVYEIEDGALTCVLDRGGR